MPKDLIHFCIARRTADRLEDTRLGATLAAEPDGLLLGAVFHDALFYAALPADAPLERAAHALHGADGEDTFALVRLLAEHVRESESPLAQAVLAGAVSHLYADAVMHPLIWHLSGDYYSADPAARSLARQRHRALESLLDMAACPTMLGRARYSLRLMLRRCPQLLDHGLPVGRLAELAGMEPGRARTALARAWTTFALFQAAYSAPLPARAAYALRPWLPRPAAELAALAYAPQLMRQTAAVSGSIGYRHPVTGDERSATLARLMDEAADQTAGLCRRLEAADFDPAVCLDAHGPSMDAGLPGVSTRRMIHFADPPFPRLD